MSSCHDSDAGAAAEPYTRHRFSIIVNRVPTRMRRPLLALALLPGLVAAQPAMFRGDPAHRGVYASPAPRLDSLAWAFKTEGRVLSSPTVAGGVVYVGSTDAHLYALGQRDGNLKWKFPTGGPVNSSPAVAQGLVIFSSVDGKVYAVDASTGKERWAFATRGERRFTAPGIHGAVPRTERMPDPFDVFLSSPVISDGVVFIGSGDHHVYALDLRTGARRWAFETGDVVHATPAVAQGRVYIGSFDRHLYALDARTGREIWRYTTGNDTTIFNQVGITSSAALAGNMVFVGARDGHFHAVDATTGALRWKVNNKGGWTIASPAVVDDMVVYPTSDGARFKAHDVATGGLRFDLANRIFTYSSPAVAGHTAYYGTADGFLHAVDLRAGKLLRSYQTRGSRAQASRFIDSTGAVRLRDMYREGTHEGMTTGFNTLMTLGSVFSSPVVADGVVYFGSTDGHLYAVK